MCCLVVEFLDYFQEIGEQRVQLHASLRNQTHQLFQSALLPPERMQSFKARVYSQVASLGGRLVGLVSFSHLQIRKLSMNLSTG